MVIKAELNVENRFKGIPEDSLYPILRKRIQNAKTQAELEGLSEYLDALSVIPSERELAERSRINRENILAEQESKRGKGTLVKDVGQIDNKAVQSLINQLNNFLRPKARKASLLSPVGSVGGGFSEFLQDVEGKQLGDNPLTRFLSDVTKGLKKTVAGLGGVQPATPEERALQALEKIVPAKPFPERTGLKGYAGVGEFKTPYGKFIVDESGALRKI